MATKKIEQAAEVVVTLTGGGVAITPGLHFYETPEWMGAAAVLAITALAIQIIRGLYGIKRDKEWDGKKDRRKQRREK